MKKAIIVGLALIPILLFITSCGVAQEEYDRVSSDLAATQTQIQSLQGELSTKETELSAARAQIQSLQAEKEALSSELIATQGLILEIMGFIGVGEEEAWKTELTVIQTAVHAMMVDNEIATLPNPIIVATNDMSAFPDTSVCGIDKIRDPYGNIYTTSDKDGYILYQHDITGDGAQTGLVNYLVSQYTTGTYTVDASGTVTQVTTGYE